MRTTTLFAAGILLLALAYSCKNESKTPTTEKTIVGTAVFEKTAGADCDQPDTLRSSCLVIKLNWPQVEQGSEALKKAVAGWAEAYLRGILAPETETETTPPALEAAAQAFINSHDDFVKEAEGSVMGNWSAETFDSVLLNDGKYLTLQIVGELYAGGAHGSPTAHVASFDASTGQQLQWSDLVTDPAALKTLAEKKFRLERADIFDDGFEFGETFPFVLPASFGLVEQGILFYYQAYEVGPYAIGSTVFVLPFSEMAALSKIKK